MPDYPGSFSALPCMARELSQEEVLDFLCQAGGKVPNAALLRHFGCFLRDSGASPEQRLQRREKFKRFVNSVAVVRQEHEGATAAATTTYVVLKSRYLDLLGEELRPLSQTVAGEEPERQPIQDCTTRQKEVPSNADPGQAYHWQNHGLSEPPRGGGGGGGQSAEAATQFHPARSELPRRGSDLVPLATKSQDAPCPPAPAQPIPLQSQLLQTAHWLSNCLPPAHNHGVTDQEAWMKEVPVFKSIRCQLSLQDMEDFVEQATCESEGSDSEEGSSGDHLQDKPPSKRESGPSRASKLVCPQPRQNQEKHISNPLPSHESVNVIPSNTDPTNSLYTGQESVALPRARKSQRHRKASSLQDKASSSEDDLNKKDHRKKNKRRPSHSRKGSQVVPTFALVPAIEAPIILKPVDSRRFSSNRDLSSNRPGPSLCVWKEQVQVDPRTSSHPQGLLSVPLEAKEHDWMVRLASGSWLQVYTLFLEEPQLAVRRDFISGYTALHWVAKHGDNRMLQDLVTGAWKAGVALDVNAKSNGGYTPLHLAAIHGHQKVMKVLVQKIKVRVDVRDNSGKKAWQYLSGSSTSGEVWQLLGAPRGKTIFPVRELTRSTSPTRKGKSQQGSGHLNRKASLAALLKPQHLKWKLANQLNNLSVLMEREVHSD
ncbi:ankyrin repeat domain-containing protein SOWAHB [Microcaecilia unicolor]|uniref:Ankyrin repeat domain-containing protein SOWAHB n=1 Tax=Microcaecilia unicolor TaxID=1415580 RepID=A0A6P7X735_9AMPH|nr:ankyrin repeat domain-containing protein SOWAHB [Microcaecilia unicolor]